MAAIVYGERIAAGAPLKLAAAAVLFDASGEKVLLTRRADNSQWCLPGGALEPGESAAEGCAREMLEETGLAVRVTRLIGVYSSPHQLLTYADGSRFHLVSLCFEVERLSGEPGLSDEVTEVGWFGPQALPGLALMDHHRERLRDAFERRAEAFVR
ncbi:MAG: NUDIX domain-containing protein [Anaerolineales bacterium]|nr:NUDIX domain-containing protein [Anaerolineales bacterium]